MNAPTPPPDQRPAETTAATGDQWVIGHGHQRAIVTEVGATLRSLHRRRPVGGRRVRVRSSGATAAGARSSPRGPTGWATAPTPSQGVTAQAPLDEIDRRNAIHGLVRWLPWRMTGRAQNRVGLACELRPSPAYPFALRIEIEYRLGREGLTVSTDAENIGDDDLPFGLGFHPYLTVGTPTVDQARLRVPARPAAGDRRAGSAHRLGVGGRHRVRLHVGAADRRDPARHRILRPRPGRRRPGAGRPRPPRRRRPG